MDRHKTKKKQAALVLLAIMVCLSSVAPPASRRAEFGVGPVCFSQMVHGRGTYYVCKWHGTGSAWSDSDSTIRGNMC
jgi:hypothetical protein